MNFSQSYLVTTSGGTALKRYAARAQLYPKDEPRQAIEIAREAIEAEAEREGAGLLVGQVWQLVDTITRYDPEVEPRVRSYSERLGE